MKCFHSILVVPACVILTACATPALWEATDPHELLPIPKSKVTEAELKAKGLTYEIDNEQNLFYVEKTRLQKTKDYALRTVGTPVAFVVDAGLVAAVAGAVVGFIVYVAPYTGTCGWDSAPQSYDRKTRDSFRDTMDTIRREDK